MMTKGAGVDYEATDKAALARAVAALEANPVLRCDMSRDCARPVSHLDRKGYVYCAEHSAQLGRGRKLKPAELWKLERGEALARY